MISDSFPNNNGKTHRAEVSRLCFTEFLFRGLSGCLTYGDDYELLVWTSAENLTEFLPRV